MAGTLKITLRKSTIGEKPKTRATVESLGLRKLHQTVERPDSPEVRGMVFRARHLLEVEESGTTPMEGEKR
ncbi:MAG: 50S ribosomal protein L30 [Acidimicrobiia bacterium]